METANINALLIRIAVLGLAGSLLNAPVALAKDPAPCDTCQDLCRLMDQYQQRVKAIEIWSQWTGYGGKHIPAGVSTGGEMEDLFKEQFDEWLDSRRPAPDAPPDDFGSLPCQLKKPDPIDDGGDDDEGGAQVQLITNVDNISCQIQTADGRVLEGVTLKEFEESVDCKVESDAVIAHEQVHRQHCLNSYRMDPTGGGDFMNTPWMTAESELDAYTKHRDELANAIRDIVRKKGCGWNPTDRQKKDPDSIPSLKQVQDMSRRAWKAAEALSDGTVTPP